MEFLSSARRRLTMPISLLMAAPAAAVWLSGCGSGSSAVPIAGIASTSATLPAAGRTARGRATFTIKWPKRTASVSSRLIPVDSNSILINILATDGTGAIVATQTLQRPVNGATTATAEFDGLYVGNYMAVASAYPSTDASGTAQATGTAPMSIVANQTIPFSLTMGSTIASVAVTPATSTIVVGANTTLTATAYDASGDVVMTSGTTWTWTSGGAQIATVSGSGAQATVTGVAAGTTQITASESESGVSGAATVNVTSGSNGTGLATSPWPKIQGNNQNTGQGIGKGATGVLKWTFGATSGSGSGAIAADGTIYIGSSDDYVYALNANGTMKWKYKTGNAVFSSPSIASDGTVYVGSDDYSLYALNSDGTLKWKYATGSYVGACPSIASDGTVYAGSQDGYLYALNADGTLKWKYQAGDANWSAIASDGTIYVGSENTNLYALNPDGTLKWKYATGDSLPFPIAVASDGAIYMTSLDGYLYALNANGALMWKYAPSLGHCTAPALGADGTIFVGTFGSITGHRGPQTFDGDLVALNPDGTLQWQYHAGPCTSSPAIGADGTVYIGNTNGVVQAVK